MDPVTTESLNSMVRWMNQICASFCDFIEKIALDGIKPDMSPVKELLGSNDGVYEKIVSVITNFGYFLLVVFLAFALLTIVFDAFARNQKSIVSLLVRAAISFILIMVASGVIDLVNEKITRPAWEYMDSSMNNLTDGYNLSLSAFSQSSVYTTLNNIDRNDETYWTQYHNLYGSSDVSREEYMDFIHTFEWLMEKYPTYLDKTYFGDDSAATIAKNNVYTNGKFILSDSAYSSYNFEMNNGDGAGHVTSSLIKYIVKEERGVPYANVKNGINERAMIGIEDENDGAAILEALLGIITMLAILFNYAKLVVEVIQHYALAGMLMVMAPVSGAFFLTDDLMPTFKAYWKMFFTESAMFVLIKLWLHLIKFAIHFMNPGIFGFLMVLAMIRIGCALPNIANRLQLNSAAMGGSLLSTALISGGATFAALSKLRQGIGSALVNTGSATGLMGLTAAGALALKKPLSPDSIAQLSRGSLGGRIRQMLTNSSMSDKSNLTGSIARTLDSMLKSGGFTNRKEALQMFNSLNAAGKKDYLSHLGNSDLLSNLQSKLGKNGDRFVPTGFSEQGIEGALMRGDKQYGTGVVSDKPGDGDMSFFTPEGDSKFFSSSLDYAESGIVDLPSGWEANGCTMEEQAAGKDLTNLTDGYAGMGDNLHVVNEGMGGTTLEGKAPAFYDSCLGEFENAPEGFDSSYDFAACAIMYNDEAGCTEFTPATIGEDGSYTYDTANMFTCSGDVTGCFDKDGSFNRNGFEIDADTQSMWSLDQTTGDTTYVPLAHEDAHGNITHAGTMVRDYALNPDSSSCRVALQDMGNGGSVVSRMYDDDFTSVRADMSEAELPQTALAKAFTAEFYGEGETARIGGTDYLTRSTGIFANSKYTGITALSFAPDGSTFDCIAREKDTGREVRLRSVNMVSNPQAASDLKGSMIFDGGREKGTWALGEAQTYASKKTVPDETNKGRTKEITVHNYQVDRKERIMRINGRQTGRSSSYDEMNKIRQKRAGQIIKDIKDGK